MNTDMKRARGFTLIELMVTLTVATILITVAVPGFRTIIQNNRATTQANDLLTAMTLARSEAIKRGIQVSVCSSTDQANCAGSTNWATGWIVFVDDDEDGARDGGEDLIRVWETLKGGSTLTADAVNNIQYLNSGMVQSGETFTLTMYNCTGSQVRKLNINATGRARVHEEDCP